MILPSWSDLVMIGIGLMLLVVGLVLSLTGSNIALAVAIIGGILIFLGEKADDRGWFDET